MLTPEPHSDWLRTDEIEDIAASVRHALRCRDSASTDKHEWKWFALAIHSALQGTLVAHLTTTASPIGAVNDKCAAAWLLHYNKGNPAPQTKLLAFPDLLKKARKNGQCGGGASYPRLQISEKERKWLTRFHDDIRNQFAHFEPMAWSLELSGMTPLGALAARLIEEAIQANWAFRHAEEETLIELRSNLKRLQNA